MQFRRAKSPRLMLAASFCCWPWTPLFFIRSLPARSTMCILAESFSSTSSPVSTPGSELPALLSSPKSAALVLRLRHLLMLRVMVNMACERDECSFMLVACVARAATPLCRQCSSSSGLATRISVCPSRVMSVPPRSLISMCASLLRGASRSRIEFWYTSKKEAVKETQDLSSCSVSSEALAKSISVTCGMTACQARPESFPSLCVPIV
mmetsp:Transcript_30644/g.72920  ORF Transcript_30644/g.72920 Transcript_30644/m.72920 type:complete len:209 (-) Transcript_30644:852-1478(-)